MNGTWIARVTLVLALSLVALGGVVHTTGSSLACPDWPLCQGMVMPPMEGGILYEHSHRLLALGVLVLVLALPSTLAARPRARRLSWIGAGLVIVQALLGATTVLLRLPPAVSVAHLACASALCAILLAIGLDPAGPRSAMGSSSRQALELALGLVFGQILLGALVRHLGAGFACGTDVLRCAGTLTPTHPAGWLQLAHRALGLAIAAAVGLVAWRARSDAGSSAHERRLALAALGLVLAQIVLGLLSVATSIHIAFATLHLVVAELLALTLLALRLPFGAREPRETAEERAAGLRLA